MTVVRLVSEAVVPQPHYSTPTVQDAKARSTGTGRRVLIAMLLVALLARLAVALYLGDAADSWIAHDQTSYDHLAQRVLAGKGFSFDQGWYPYVPADTQTSYFSTTMVLYLASIYAVFGHHPVAARIVTALVGVASCYLVYRLGQRLFSERAGLLAACLMAGYAYLAYYSATLMTETPFIAATLLALAAALDIVAQSTWQRWAKLGIYLSVAILFRQSALPFAALLIAWIFVTAKPRPRVWTAFLPVVIIVLSILPWTLRNYELYGRLMLSESQFGHVFWVGNHPDRDLSFDDPAWVAPIPEDIRSLNEADKTYILLQRGIDNVLADPGRFALLSLNRARTLFAFWPSPGSGAENNIARMLSFTALLPFMLYGLLVSLRCWRRYVVLYLFVASQLAVPVASWALIRYRLPIDPILILFAAAGIWDLADRLMARFPRIRWLYGLTAGG